MEKKSNGLQLFSAVIIALTGWAALALQLYIIVTNNIASNSSVADGIIRFFSFFTVLTNILVALSLTISLVAPYSALGKFFSRTTVKSSVAVYIIIVSIVYNIALKNLWDPQGLQLIADILLHQAIPVLYTLYWLAFVPKGTLTWKFPVRLLVYPLFYLIYVIVRGGATGHYPYPFMDVSQIGTEKMIINALIIMTAFIVIGFLIVGIDSYMKPKVRKHSGRSKK